MTPLRFRAWHPGKKKMHPVYCLTWDEEPEVSFWRNPGTDDNTLFTEPIRKVVVMQSTGLTDKNGKEIFEGDVVANWAKQSFAVFWNQERATYDLKNSAVTLAESDPSKRLVVIGNIYENPDLLPSAA